MKKYENFNLIQKTDIQDFSGLETEISTHFLNLVEKNNDLTDKYSQILKRFEFLPIDKVWLGKKNFKAFGNSVEEVVNTIVEEVAKIKTETEIN